MSEAKDREFKPTDEEIRSSIENFRIEPSAKVWKGMNRKLLWMEMTRFNFTNVPLFYRIAVPSMILLFLGLGIYLGRNDISNVNIPVASAPVVKDGAVTAEKPLEAEKHEMPGGKENRGSESITAVRENIPAAANAETPAGTAATGPVSKETFIPVEAPVVSSAPEAVAGHEMALAVMNPLDFTGFVNSVSPDIYAVANPVPPNPDLNLGGDIITNRIPRSLSIGANLSPDMVFYKNTSDYFKYSYGFDVSTQYSIGKFYLQGGIGLTYSSDIGSYDVSYVKNDSVGYYYAVTSFHRDDGDPNRIVYDMNKVTIFDSNQYYYQYNTENSYLYLQIPVSFGYRAVTMPRWSLSAEAGAIYSYLIWKNEPAPNFYAPDSKVNEITRIDPLRLSSNVAVSGGIRFDYHFARQFDLMAEPVFKYYINAIEGAGGAQVDQPWSVGLKVGIWYRFNLK